MRHASVLYICAPHHAMSSSTSKGGTYIALTTAYEEPISCQNNFHPTSIAWTGSSTPTSILVSKAVKSCYPSGWDGLGTGEYLSPAVCPSGWNYNVLNQATYSSSGATTALCCASGYQLRHVEEDQQQARQIFPNQCERRINDQPEENQSATATYPNAVPDATHGTLLLHQAWVVTWDASDMATLSPELPTLYNRQFEPRMETSQPAASQTSYEQDHGSFSASDARFLFIGIPVIVGVILIGCFTLCWWNRRKMRRRRGQEVAMDLLPDQSGDASSSARRK